MIQAWLQDSQPPSAQRPSSKANGLDLTLEPPAMSALNELVAGSVVGLIHCLTRNQTVDKTGRPSSYRFARRKATG